MGTQNIGLNRWVKKYSQFYAKKICLSKPIYPVDEDALLVVRRIGNLGSRLYNYTTFIPPLSTLA